MKTLRILLIVVLAGLLVAAYSMSIGLSFQVTVALFFGEVVLCFGGIFFAIYVMPELLSRHIEWQLKRQGR